MSSQSSSPLLRLQYVLTDNPKLIGVFVTIAIICGVILTTGLVTPAFSASPFSETNENTDAHPEMHHSLLIETNHSTTVIRDTEAYDEGEQLTNKVMYPIDNTDKLSYTVAVTGENVDITDVSLALSYDATKRSDTSTVFWSKDTPLANTSSITDGSTSLQTEIDDRAVAERQSNLQDEFGADTAVVVDVVVEVSYTYTGSDGIKHEDSEVITDAFDFRNKMYEVGSTTHQETVTTGGEPPAPANDSLLNTIFSAIGVLAFSLAILTSVCVHRYDAEDLSDQLEKSRLSEWITEVEAFTPHGNMRTVKVSRLSDLVDLAIDTQNRVIYIKTTDEYVVLEGDLMFLCHPDGLEGEPSRTLSFGMSDFQNDSDASNTSPEQEDVEEEFGFKEFTPPDSPNNTE